MRFKIANRKNLLVFKKNFNQIEKDFAIQNFVLFSMKKFFFLIQLNYRVSVSLVDFDLYIISWLVGLIFFKLKIIVFISLFSNQ